jgi:putative ABC transport system permease protein
MFSIVQCLLLRPLPYQNPEELTMLWKTYEPVAREWPASIPDLVDLREKNTSFASLSATSYHAFSLSSAEGGPHAVPAEYLGGAAVSADFFSMLGIGSMYGRLLGPDDDRLDAPRVCVLSAEVWRRRFAADPNVVGRSVMLNGLPFTVVGIAPEGFRFSGPRGDRSDVWVPLAHAEKYAERSTSRGDNHLRVMGRRRPGVTLAQAQSDMDRVTKDLQAQHRSWTRRGLYLVDLQEALVGSAKSSIVVLFGAVGLVFLVVCANVASLLLARGATRRAEMAARAALGATQARLVMQLVTESVVVFLLGGAGGAVAAYWLVDFFAQSVLREVWAANIAIRLDAAAVAFSIVVALACGVVFGIAPALATSRVAPQSVLKETAAQAGVSRSQRLLRGGLVVAQVALAFSLLVGSGLALRGYLKVAGTPPGFDFENLVTAKIALPETRYSDEDRVAAFYEELVARLGREPSVLSVAANSAMPMSGGSSNGWFKIEGRPPWPPGEGPILERNVVTAGYFATMGIPVLRGREFTLADRKGTPQVAVISQETAARFFPGEDPIGRRIDLQDRDGEQWLEIVGVVGDVRRVGLAAPIAVEAFVPVAQHAHPFMTLGIRSAHPDATMKDMVRVTSTLDPNLALFSVRLMKDRVADTFAEQRFLTLLLGAFAIAALVLSTMGLFGLVAYTTSQRTREIGIRMALGSSPRGVVGLVVRGGARLVALGLVLGSLGAVVVSRTLAGRVDGVTSFDPLVYAAIPLLLGVAGIVSCALPAWRAVRIPPSVALRYE